jgi:hypothetical protein
MGHCGEIEKLTKVLINMSYTYEKAIKVFRLRLSKAFLCPKRKETLPLL